MKLIKAWYRRHWRTFDFIESIVTSREAKFLSVSFTSLLTLIFLSKYYIETRFGISLVGNHPINDIWFISIFFGWGIGVLMMIWIDKVLER